MRRRRSESIPLAPRWLPLIAERLREDAAFVSGFGPLMRDYAWTADALREAELWWVSRDMTTLAVDTAEDRDGFDPQATVTMPSDDGFVVWEGGLPLEIEQPPQIFRGRVRVDALLWHWDDGSLRYQLFSSDAGLLAEHRRLLGDGMWRLPLVHAEPPRTSGDHVEFLTRVLAAAWELSRQPTVASVRDGSWDEKRDGMAPRALARTRGRHAGDDVRLVLLRENPAPSRSDGHGTDAGSGREYTCRWIVRGFYRQQPYGPGHELRRCQWIPPYVAGPEDKPLRIKPTVHVWRK